MSDDKSKSRFNEPFWGVQADGGDAMSQVEVDKNHVTFFGFVEEESVHDLSVALRKIDQENQIKQIQWGVAEIPIHLHIHNWGGELHSAFSAVDVIRNLKSPVWTYVEGASMSAATLVSCAGDYRFIGKHSHMLLHQIRGFVWGKYSEIKDHTKGWDDLMELLYDFYVERSTMTREEVKALLSRELTLGSQECLKKGLVDEII